jgi:hypothetical protein
MKRVRSMRQSVLLARAASSFWYLICRRTCIGLLRRKYEESVDRSFCWSLSRLSWKQLIFSPLSFDASKFGKGNNRRTDHSVWNRHPNRNYQVLSFGDESKNLIGYQHEITAMQLQPAAVIIYMIKINYEDFGTTKEITSTMYRINSSVFPCVLVTSHYYQAVNLHNRKNEYMIVHLCLASPDKTKWLGFATELSMLAYMRLMKMSVGLTTS